MAPIDWRSTNRASLIASLTSIIAFAIAISIFFLWLIHSETVKTIFPATGPVTAFGFILLLIATYCFRHKTTRRAAQALIFTVVVISLLALAESLFSIDFQVNQLFVVGALADAPHLFAPNIALTFILISAALPLPYSTLPNRHKWSQLLLIVVAIIAGIAFLGHLYNVEQFYQAPAGPPMSLTTCVLALLICVVILYPQRDQGLLCIVTTPTSGGLMMRRVLPLIIVLPHVFGLFFLYGTDNIFLPLQAWTVLFIITVVTILIGVVWWNSQKIDTAERARMLLEQTLRENEARYRALFEHSSDTILITNDDAHYIDANPQAECLTGYTRAELLQLRVGDLTGLKSPRTGKDLYEQLKKDAGISGEYILKRKDGQEIAIEYTATKIAPGVYQSVLHDISEYKRVEENLRRALAKERDLNELKSRFIAIVSHEFRTPLSIIRSSTDLMLIYKHRMTEKQSQERLENVQAQVSHMVQLLEDVLTLGKAGMVGLEFNPELVDLNAFCTQLVADFSLTISTHEIVFTSADSYIPATIDQKLLRQALTNLLSNAVKYSPEENQILFDLECRDAEVVFRIRDFGIGIPVEDQARLFEHFHRASNVGGISGTGLGLSIVKQAVEAHGGRINFHSTSGTTFVVVLPSFQSPTTKALISAGRSGLH